MLLPDGSMAHRCHRCAAWRCACHVGGTGGPFVQRGEARPRGRGPEVDSPPRTGMQLITAIPLPRGRVQFDLQLWGEDVTFIFRGATLEGRGPTSQSVYVERRPAVRSTRGTRRQRQRQRHRQRPEATTRAQSQDDSTPRQTGTGGLHGEGSIGAGARGAGPTGASGGYPASVMLACQRLFEAVRQARRIPASTGAREPFWFLPGIATEEDLAQLLHLHCIIP